MGGMRVSLIELVSFAAIDMYDYLPVLYTSFVPSDKTYGWDI